MLVKKNKQTLTILPLKSLFIPPRDLFLIETKRNGFTFSLFAETSDKKITLCQADMTEYELAF